ncbi:FR47-like protein [Seminavis robusta]|uniref:FR47-like protein n=1 Tax=Seminavis robusta TaxID=568900 RepID=A0A9N8HVA4_9STRA|nr:FR47-like protein [Seminavis robusta]|eukprot:Sro1954_g307610.1 FR47-like protein (313) ;mRNA; f:5189-6127
MNGDCRTPIASSDQLLEQAAFDSHRSRKQSPLWNHHLRQCLSSPADSGVWIVSKRTTIQQEEEVIESVAQVDLAKQGIRLFCRDPLDAFACSAAVEVTRAALDLLPSETSVDDKRENGSENTRSVLFKALDRRLISVLQDSLGGNYNVTTVFHSKCGMWVCPTLQRNNNEEDLHSIPSNAFLRSLTQYDAVLVNSRWTYAGNGSLDMIQTMIARGGGCCGLQVDGTLVAWVCQYLDGALGMLWTEEGHRKRGYVSMVMRAAVKSIQSASESNDEPVVAFVVDDNQASSELLTKLKWERVADADWVRLSFERK